MADDQCRRVKNGAGELMKIAYYPGCSGRSTAREYSESIKSTARYLGIDLVEIPEWNCCGASSAHIIDDEVALALPGRNLALAEKMCLDIAVSCPACLHRLIVSRMEFERKPRLRTRIEECIGMPLQLSREAKHILEVFNNDVRIDAIQRKVTKSLKGLKVVVYYGCYHRLQEIEDCSASENRTMESIMETVGAEVLAWSFKDDCCGAGLSLTKPEIIERLISRIISSAAEVGANAIVTACPLCQANLDMLQGKGTQACIPILYFSELIALSLGSSKVPSWLRRHMVDPFATLKRLKLL